MVSKTPAAPHDEANEPVDSHEPRPIRAIAFLPSAATLGNLLCGFLAIVCCLFSIRAAYLPPTPVRHWLLAELVPTYITAGVYMLLLAMIFDALDGRLARLARRTTEFGAQLDSLADVVSFGIAPVALFLTLLLPLSVPGEHGTAIVPKPEWRLGIFCALVYVACAGIRLARYNAENTSGEEAQKKFTGMPSPGAAAGFLGLLLLHEELARMNAHWWGVDWVGVVRWALGPAALLLGILMVSRLEHIHVFNVYVRREHPPTHLVWLIMFVALGIYWLQGLLIAAAVAYVGSNLLMNVRNWIMPPRDSAGPRPFHPN